MNEFPQAAIVAAVSSSFDEYGFGLAAETAKCLAAIVRKLIRAAESLTAECAPASLHGPHSLEALFANWQTGNLDEGGSAETAIAGEESGKQALGSRCHPGDKDSLSGNNFGPGSSS
jgi:hypothetical protein